METSLVSTDAWFSPGIRSYRDCIKARWPLMLPHMNLAQSPRGSDHPGMSCPFPSLCLSHCRCRGAWHAKPFLQIYMCSNHSISNRSSGYPFSHLEVSGLPCLVTLMRALQALGPRNLPISEWLCWGTSALFYCLTNTAVWKYGP